MLDVFPSFLFDSMKSDHRLRCGLPQNLLTVSTVSSYPQVLESHFERNVPYASTIY